MKEITNNSPMSLNHKTTDNLQGISEQALLSAKKQWIKPETRVLNISNSGTDVIDVSSAKRDFS